MIEFKTGDIFDEDVDALVNTVNCVGVMGRGIALEFKKAFPKNFDSYLVACKRKEVKPGKMHTVETGRFFPRYIINFPTKRHWRDMSRMEDIESGLVALAKEINERNIQSIAIPALGSGLGGLDWPEVRQCIESRLKGLDGLKVIVFEPDSGSSARRSANSLERGEQTMKDYLETWRRPSRPPFIDNCLIWNWPESKITPLHKPTGPKSYELKGHLVNSQRAGGSYVLWRTIAILLEDLDDLQRAKLTSWLIDQRTQGDLEPEITPGAIDYAIQRPSLQVHERAERLLKCLANQADTIGTGVNVRHDTPLPYAWSESTGWTEVVYLLNYLLDSGWIDHPGTNDRINQTHGLVNGVVTVAGYNQIAELSVAIDSTQAFVAMWFNPEVKQIYDQGIIPAVEAAGFTPYRVDQKDFLGKIDDQIIAEIRRSRFLIADMTHGDEGARGSVYFEAGFALGLGIPVIYTCRSDMYDDLHFDTRQYPHIEWKNEDIESFRQNLENRIRASIT